MTRLRTLQPTLRTVSTAAAMPQQKVKAAHYYTPEHRAWARSVVARAGRACQDCGRTETRLFADHVVELQDGGAPFDLANGRALCGACHTRKTAAARALRQAGGGRSIPGGEGGLARIGAQPGILFRPVCARDGGHEG